MPETRIIFICHGNICRSPMAESVMAFLLHNANRHDITVDSAAVSTEELGNPVHPGTRRKLREQNIPCLPHNAHQLSRAEADRATLLIGMDTNNCHYIRRLAGPQNTHKIHRLLDYTDAPRDISDPWYTGNFDDTFDDVLAGCQALLRALSLPDA